MRVFTQKYQLNPLEEHPWTKPAPGVFPAYDAWVAEFDAIFPNAVLKDMHQLDYRVAFETPEHEEFFIVGYYWGDESTIPAATHWINHNKVLGVEQLRWLITCSDDEHPAIGPASNLKIDDLLTAKQGVKKGYFLWETYDVMRTD